MKKNMSKIAIVLITGLLFTAAGFSQSNQYIRNSLNLQNGANFNIGGNGNANVFNAQTHYEIGGQRVLVASPFPQRNLFIGTDAGINNTPGTNLGTRNTFIGINAGRFNTTGFNNTSVGQAAGLQNTTGFENSFFGLNAGRNNTTGFRNSIFGSSAGEQLTIGSSNSFFGHFAGRRTTVGGGNSFFGSSAGQENLGIQNSFFGFLAGGANTNGTFNTFVGTRAGVSNVSGSYNTLIGANADLGTDGPPLQYATAVGAESVVHNSNTIQLGRISGADMVNISGQLAVGSFGAGSIAVCRTLGGLISNCSSSIRYKTDVENFQPGLSLIKKLRPVSFQWKDSEMLDLGLIAEEVGEIEPLLVTKNKDGVVEGIKYEKIGLILVNAVKEQQRQIRLQRERNADLRKELDKLKTMICSRGEFAKSC